MSHTDTVLQLAEYRLGKLREEADLLDSVFAEYAAIADKKEAAPLLPKPLIGHYPMLETVSCGCDLCADWALRRQELSQSAPFVPAGHRYHTCDCPSCKFVKRVWMNYKAAENRRDLLIGASFHAYHNSQHGERVMDWFVGEISQPHRSGNWWAIKGGWYPMSHWLRKCELVLSPVVSGAVFEGIEL